MVVFGYKILENRKWISQFMKQDKGIKLQKINIELKRIVLKNVKLEITLNI